MWLVSYIWKNERSLRSGKNKSHFKTSFYLGPLWNRHDVLSLLLHHFKKLQDFSKNLIKLIVYQNNSLLHLCWNVHFTICIYRVFGHVRSGVKSNCGPVLSPPKGSFWAEPVWGDCTFSSRGKEAEAQCHPHSVQSGRPSIPCSHYSIYPTAHETWTR